MDIQEYIIYLYKQGFTIPTIVKRVYRQILTIDTPVTEKYVLNLVEKTILEHTTTQRT